MFKKTVKFILMRNLYYSHFKAGERLAFAKFIFNQGRKKNLQISFCNPLNSSETLTNKGFHYRRKRKRVDVEIHFLYLSHD